MRSKVYKVKICGTTSVEDAQMAVSAGADYLGILVNVQGSERSLTIEQAEIVAKSSGIPVVTLLSNMGVEGICSVVDTLKPFAIHLLGQTPLQMIQELKRKLACQVWLTVYLPPKGEAEVDVLAVKDLVRNYERAGADAIVIDTMKLAPGGKVSRYGGTGRVCDWDIASELVKSAHVPVFLAGGITPDNVRSALQKVDPYGVDLASGVEKSKGKRDPQKVKKLIREVRAVESMVTLTSNSPEFTKSIGREIGKEACRGSVIALCGELGTGKTVFVQGLAEGLNVGVIATSPTFVIISEYKGRYPLYHIDTYRLNSSEDLIELGYEEFFYSDGVTVIEWAQKVEDLLPEEYLRVEFLFLNESQREIAIIPYGQSYEGLVEKVRKSMGL